MSLSIEVVKKSGSLGTRLAPPEIDGRALVVGATGELQLDGEGVAGEHLLLLVKRGRLLAASVNADIPAFTEVSAIPTRWVELVVPCNVLVGDAVLRFAWTTERPVIVSDAGPSEPSEPTILAPLPQPPAEDEYEHTAAYARPPVPRPLPPPPFLRAPRPPMFAFPPPPAAVPAAVIARRSSPRPIGPGLFGVVLGYVLHAWRSLLARSDEAPQGACHESEVRSNIPA